MTPDTLKEMAEDIGSGGEVPMTAEQWLAWARGSVVEALTETAKRSGSMASIQRIGHILGGIDEAIEQESDVYRHISGQVCKSDLAVDDACPGCRRFTLEFWRNSEKPSGMLLCSSCGWRCAE